MAATREAFLRELRSHLGETEHPPGSDTTIFNTFMGVGPGPWCMDFVSTCLWAVGNRDLAGLRERHGTSWVPDTYGWAQSQGRIRSWAEAQPGDGVIFAWPGTYRNAHGNHIGVLVSKSPFVTIDGDTHRSGVETDRDDRVMLHDDRSPSLAVAFVRFTLEQGDDTTVDYAPPWPGRILTLRTPLMHGADVRMWQQEMSQRGRALAPDGYYGPESERVCRSFQEAQGLVIDGQVGPTTWHVTWATATQSVEAANGATGTATGVDRLEAPSVDEAIEIRRRTGASWWGVYVGGPCSAGRGWTHETVRALGKAGFRFLPIFVGQNDVPLSPARTFTRAQGIEDGGATVLIVQAYGWRAHERVPVCLDVEAMTYENHPAEAVDYIAGWSSTVRAAGYQPVVYSSPGCLATIDRLATSERPDGVWVASWLGRRHVDNSLHPSAIPHFPSEAWADARVWQYEGDIPVPGARSAVDVSCAALPLAPAPG